MGRAFGFIAVVMTVAIGGYIYTQQAQSVTSIGSNPQTTVDVIGVRNDLMAIANAERQYWATNSRYASLEELQTDGMIQIGSRDGYSYSAEVSDIEFKIIATYSGSGPDAPNQISVNEAMILSQR
jgi:hypothetical protein